MTPHPSRDFILSEHSINGFVVGTTWEGIVGYLPFSTSLPIKTQEPFFYKKLLPVLLRRVGGDFQNPKFAPTTEIILIRRKFETPITYLHKRTLTIERWFPDLCPKNFSPYEELINEYLEST